MKALFVSDQHIGHPLSNYPAIFRMLEAAKAYDHVYFVGDTFELIWSDWETIKTHEPYWTAYNMVYRLLCGSGQKVFLIEGNHDPIEKLNEGLPEWVEPLPFTEFNGYRVQHGYQFDPSIGVMDRILGPFYRFLPFFSNRVWGTPWQEKQKGETQRWDFHQRKIASRATAWCVNNKKNLIYGHTHLPFEQDFPTLDTSLKNCGDMVDSVTVLEYNRGGFRFLKF